MAAQEVCVPSTLGHMANFYFPIAFDCTRSSAEREQKIGRFGMLWMSYYQSIALVR